MILRFSERDATNTGHGFSCAQEEPLAPERFRALARKKMEINKIVIAGLETIAGEIGCSKKTLYKWIRQRGFPAFKMDGIWRAMPKDIEAWFDSIREDKPGRSR